MVELELVDVVELELVRRGGRAGRWRRGRRSSTTTWHRRARLASRTGVTGPRVMRIGPGATFTVNVSGLAADDRDRDRARVGRGRGDGATVPSAPTLEPARPAPTTASARRQLRPSPPAIIRVRGGCRTLRARSTCRRNATGWFWRFATPNRDSHTGHRSSRRLGPERRIPSDCRTAARHRRISAAHGQVHSTLSLKLRSET